MKRAITTTDAPAALGPYSQAIATGSFLFCAGQVPIDPVTGDLVAGDIAAQATQVLLNLEAVLKANGMDFSNVVKTTVFLTNLGEFATLNAVYAGFFSKPFPARSTVQVSALPKGAQVEIELIATA